MVHARGFLAEFFFGVSVVLILQNVADADDDSDIVSLNLTSQVREPRISLQVLEKIEKLYWISVVRGTFYISWKYFHTALLSWKRGEKTFEVPNYLPSFCPLRHGHHEQ